MKKVNVHEKQFITCSYTEQEERKRKERESGLVADCRKKGMKYLIKMNRKELLIKEVKQLLDKEEK